MGCSRPAKGAEAAFSLLFLVLQQAVGNILPSLQQSLRGFELRFVWRIRSLHHLHDGVNGGSCYTVQLVGQLGIVSGVLFDDLKQSSAGFSGLVFGLGHGSVVHSILYLFSPVPHLFRRKTTLFLGLPKIREIRFFSMFALRSSTVQRAFPSRVFLAFRGLRFGRLSGVQRVRQICAAFMAACILLFVFFNFLFIFAG